METIGIIAAMAQESGAFLPFIKEQERSRLGGLRCQRFQLGQRDCWMVTSGMGLRRAAQATRRLVEAADPQLLVSVGVAGATSQDLAIGDVVACQQTCLLERGAAGPRQSMAILSQAAWQAAEQALQGRGVRLVPGTAVSTRGGQFIQQEAQMPDPVLEMETVGIAREAAEYSIPLLSLRAISDGPLAPIPFDLETMLDEQDNLRIGRVLTAVLAHPQMIPQLLRMGRHTRQAAENAAAALTAALSQAGGLVFQG